MLRPKSKSKLFWTAVALFIDCIARLVLLGVSLDEIFENIKYNETAYKRLFKQGVPERL